MRVGDSVSGVDGVGDKGGPRGLGAENKERDPVVWGWGCGESESVVWGESKELGISVLVALLLNRGG